jgi:aminocarboxymuconate-semialdehyde decarboxylase
LPPIEAVRRLYVDSLVHSAAYGRLLLDIVGEDRILLGSDWPFPMGADHADADIGAFGPEIARRIREENPASVFGKRLTPR